MTEAEKRISGVAESWRRKYEGVVELNTALQAVRDVALQVRDLARAASNRDLGAKRAAEAKLAAALKELRSARDVIDGFRRERSERAREAISAAREKGGECGGPLPERRPKRGIYVASKCSHAWMWVLLRDGGAPIISTWIDEAGPGQSSDLSDLAVRCIREASECSALVLYCEPGEFLKGALMEAGAALSAGIPVYCVGTCENLSPVLARHPLWIRRETLREAIDAAGGKGGSN